MNMAEGSLEESRYYLILARDLSYGGTEELMALLEDVSRLLHAYTAALLTPDSCLLISCLLTPFLLTKTIQLAILRADQYASPGNRRRSG